MKERDFSRVMKFLVRSHECWKPNTKEISYTNSVLKDLSLV